MIDDDLLKRLLRINDEFFQICKWLGQKRDIERVASVWRSGDVFNFRKGE